MRKLIFLWFMVSVMRELLPSVSWANTLPFINEFHYDNSGTDTGEAIEIAGPAGLNLSGWSIVLYNGTGGAAYDTKVLSGTIPDLQNGLGALFFSYPANGIQNGASDGIALIDPLSAAAQFLSYEGTFTAVGGPASGIASTDIGASEPSDTPLGYSLQLVGFGKEYSDFNWMGAMTNTFGAINTGQAFINSPIVPEPATLLLFGLGWLGLAFRRNKGDA